MAEELCAGLNLPLLVIPIQHEEDPVVRGKAEAETLIGWLGELG